MLEVNYQFTLPGTAQEVYTYLCNPNNDAQWQRACDSAALIDTDQPALGARYRICFKLLGKVMNFVAHITTYEPFKTYAFAVLEGSFHYQGTYQFVEIVDSKSGAVSTQVDWLFATEPGKFFGILPASLLRKVLLSQVEDDTRRLQTQWANHQNNKEHVCSAM